MAKFSKIRLFGFEQNSQFDQIENVLSDAGLDIVDNAEHADLIMVLGGDGTMLHQAKHAHQYQIPIFGVNMGHTGFLADVDYSDKDLIQAILEGHYIEDTRQVLKCEINNKTYYGINELMVCKAKPTRMIKYEIFVDDQFLYEQIADGIIISTTTGSSAYALSAGGPILHPKAKVFGLIPVCSSKITSHPIIIDEQSKIEIVLHEWKGSESTVAIDAEEIKVADIKRIKISLDERRLCLLHPMHYDYYRTLQHKLNWESDPAQ
jgi:NAD+ kinase